MDTTIQEIVIINGHQQREVVSADWGAASVLEEFPKDEEENKILPLSKGETKRVSKSESDSPFMQ